MISPETVTKESSFVGDECAYCKQPFNPGDVAVTCPVDEAHHHTHCWVECGNKCSALACAGSGLIVETPQAPTDEEAVRRRRRLGRQSRTVAEAANPSSRTVVAPAPAEPTTPQQRPESAAPSTQNNQQTEQNSDLTAQLPFSMRMAQSCVVFSIAIAIIVMTFSCFGLWAIADYIMIEELGWNYRPIPDLIFPFFLY